MSNVFICIRKEEIRPVDRVVVDHEQEDRPQVVCIGVMIVKVVVVWMCAREEVDIIVVI